MVCSQCGKERSGSYTWWSTPREGGKYVCQPCGGKGIRHSVRPNKRPHDGVVHTMALSPLTGVALRTLRRGRSR